MARYLVTHSLLSSWLYAMKDRPYEDATTERDSYQEFLQALTQKPIDQTKAMRNGVEFEDLVTQIVNGFGDTDHKWYEAASKVADIVKGGSLQYKAKKEIQVSDISVLLYGRLDVLKAGEIIDIKFSKSYERGKHFASTQHPTYLEIVPEAESFTYLISNGIDVWTEAYRREETPDITVIISDFIEYLKGNGLWDLYAKHWTAL